MTRIGHSEKLLFMRVFIAVLVLIFSLQSLTKADDVEDFEIEGIRVGDSLLEHFTEDEINNFESQIYSIPEENKYKRIYILDNIKNYEYLAIDFKLNDDQYIVHGLAGMIDYSNKKECSDKQNEIAKDLKSIISQEPKKTTITSKYDKTGKSKIYYYYYKLNNGYLQIICSIYAEHTNIQGGLDLSVRSKEFQMWLDS